MDRSEKHIISQISATLENSDDSNREEFIAMLLKTEKIFIYGVGRSGLVGKAFAIRLVQLGMKVFFVGETITPIVEPGDLVIIISNTGETMSAIQTANIVRRVGADVVTITAKPHSKLAHAANMIIHINVKSSELDRKIAPLGTIFEDTTVIYLDSIVSDLMNKLGEDEKNMRTRHAIWV